MRSIFMVFLLLLYFGTFALSEENGRFLDHVTPDDPSYAACIRGCNGACKPPKEPCLALCIEQCPPPFTP